MDLEDREETSYIVVATAADVEGREGTKVSAELV